MPAALPSLHARPRRVDAAAKRRFPIPRSFPLVLADRLDRVLDRGAVETGDIPLAGFSAAGDSGGRGLDAADRRLAWRAPPAAMRSPDLSSGSSWGGPIVLPAAVAVLQWVYAIRFDWPVWVAVGLVAAVIAVAADPLARGRRQASMAAAALSLAAQFVVVMTLILPPAGRNVLRPRLGRAFQSRGQSSGAAVRGRGADRLVCVLSRPAASRRAEGGSSSVSSRRSADAIAAGRRRRSAEAETSRRPPNGSISATNPTSRSGGIGCIALRSRKRLRMMACDVTFCSASAIPSDRTTPAAGRRAERTSPPDSRRPRRSARRWGSAPRKRSAGSRPAPPAA